MQSSLQTEHLCLTRLVAGEDAWPEFIKLFGDFIHRELARLDVPAGGDREDLLQDILVRLISNDCALIRRHLQQYAHVPFWIVLRTISKNCRISRLRRDRRWRELAALDDEPELRTVLSQDWAGDPALRLYRDVRLACLLQDLARPDRDGRNLEILYRRFVEDESVIDIAGSLRLMPNAVTQRIRHCLKRAKNRLSGVVLFKEASDG